jgi:hypothetical protein
MKYSNEIFFLVFALVLWGLLYGSRFILKSNKAGQSEKLWLTALTLTATSFTLFALAPSISLFLLTLANTCFVASFIYFGLFCRSLNVPVPKYVNILVLAGLLAFAVLFEYLRHNGIFIQRVGLISAMGATCFVWELRELRHIRGIGSTQLRFLVGTIAIELVLTIARIVALYIDGAIAIPNLYQEGVTSASLRWAWLGISILSYVAVLGYWLEKLSFENMQVARENQKITE